MDLKVARRPWFLLPKSGEDSSPRFDLSCVRRLVFVEMVSLMMIKHVYVYVCREGEKGLGLQREKEEKREERKSFDWLSGSVGEEI
ncbi:hypothetical protein D8674_021759 [Pyrus ussuriensis x Pyrus communis]|uniref:Uncharacterized protein n=1 Tax=Pyrus ussuriensis x Pyrus communis TaxID=2448454 RepID=A0A5N5GMS7_9ROSA|nr:hypothetical protein D8674_021759 [Pyrus ussuriensis x Pyrus communis]